MITDTSRRSSAKPVATMRYILFLSVTVPLKNIAGPRLRDCCACMRGVME